MGRIVGAFGSSHIIMERGHVAEQADRVFDGMKAMREKVIALRPDIMVIVTNDHMYNHGSELQAPFSVGMADEYTPYGDMNLPRKPFRGHTEFGISLAQTAADEGFDVGYARKLRPDHGLTVPALMLTPAGVPVAPVLTSPFMRPFPPSPKRCYAFGKVLRRAIEHNRPAHERIVIVGAGGLSHWLALDKMGQVNPDFDKWVLDHLASGRAAELARMSAADMLEQAGNGGMETLNWLVMAGAVEGATGTPVFYEEMPSWLTGMAAIEMNVPA